MRGPKKVFQDIPRKTEKHDNTWRKFILYILYYILHWYFVFVLGNKYFYSPDKIWTQRNERELLNKGMSERLLNGRSYFDYMIHHRPRLWFPHHIAVSGPRPPLRSPQLVGDTGHPWHALTLGKPNQKKRPTDSKHLQYF